MEACLILDALFYKTTGLGACAWAQPCGIEQPTMTEEAVVVEGACLLVDALFKKTRGLGACARACPIVDVVFLTRQRGLGACGRGQPCGVAQPTMKGAGGVWSRAASWSRAAL